MTKNEKDNLQLLLDNHESVFDSWGDEPTVEEIYKFLSSDPKSKVRQFFKDNDACFEGSWRYFHFKTVESAIRSIHAEGDEAAIEYFLNSQDVDTWGYDSKPPCNYTVKELLDLIPTAYRTKKAAKKPTKKGAKRAKSSRRSR